MTLLDKINPEKIKKWAWYGGKNNDLLILCVTFISGLLLGAYLW